MYKITEELMMMMMNMMMVMNHYEQHYNANHLSFYVLDVTRSACLVFYSLIFDWL